LFLTLDLSENNLQYLFGEEGSGAGGFSLELMDRLKSKRSVVSVVLATGYDREFIEWLFSSSEQFNDDFGEKWQVVIPAKKKINSFAGVSIDQFDLNLSKSIMETCKIDRADLPGLLFIDFRPSYESIFVSLRDKKDEDARRAFFEYSANVITRAHASEETTDDEYRAAVATNLRRNKRIAGVVSGVRRVAPAAAKAAKLLMSGGVSP